MEKNPLADKEIFENFKKARAESEANEKEERIKEYRNRGIPEHIIDRLESGKLEKKQVNAVLRLPWESLNQKPIIDVKKAQAVLQADHVGMDDVKRRIMDYIRSEFRRGAVLLFVGPPGVGKTSLAMQIAAAIGRSAYPVALSGIASAHEITGVDPTFSESKPGEIIRAIVSVDSFYPLIILDEIDKVGHSTEHGDPQNALLEVLDTNRKLFKDRFLDIPIDLSDIIFIATANDISNISPVLRDRLEIIEIGGYTKELKVRILKEQVIPKVTREILDNPDEILNISDDAIERIVKEYSTMPGIRELYDEVDFITRRANSNFQIQGRKNIVTAENIEEYLGQPKAFYFPREAVPAIGLVNTAIQISTKFAKVITIQAEIIKGTGKTICTGGVKDFAREAVTIAETIISKLGKSKRIPMEYDFFEKNNVHVHSEYLPTIKFDYSVSLAILVVLLSKKLQYKISLNTMFIGELLSDGTVKYISNIEEYLIAALESNIKFVVIPYDNQLKDKVILQSYSERLQIIPISNIEEILKEFFNI